MKFERQTCDPKFHEFDYKLTIEDGLPVRHHSSRAAFSWAFKPIPI
jgi:hypothetical protein